MCDSLALLNVFVKKRYGSNATMYAGTGNEREIQTTTAGDSCTLLQRASSLRASKAKSCQTCENFIRFEMQEAEMCDSFILSHTLSTNGTVQAQPCIAGTGNEGEIQTTTPGWLWGPYLMTAARFRKELAG